MSQHIFVFVALAHASDGPTMHVSVRIGVAQRCVWPGRHNAHLCASDKPTTHVNSVGARRWGCAADSEWTIAHPVVRKKTVYDILRSLLPYG